MQSYKKNLLNQLLSYSFEERPHNSDDTVFDFLLQSRIPYKKFLNPFSEYDIQITEECLHQFNLNTYKNNKILSLPGAILKRCHLAYCFIREAKVTILDNPTSDLDFHSIFTLQRYMSKYVMDGNKIIIIASNDLNFVIQTSDRIIILKDGEIALEGTHNMIDGETIKKYFNIDIIYSKNIYNGKPVINLFPMN